MLVPFPEAIFSFSFSSEVLPFDHVTVQLQFPKRTELQNAEVGIIFGVNQLELPCPPPSSF